MNRRFVYARGPITGPVASAHLRSPCCARQTSGSTGAALLHRPWHVHSTRENAGRAHRPRSIQLICRVHLANLHYISTGIADQDSVHDGDHRAVWVSCMRLTCRTDKQDGRTAVFPGHDRAPDRFGVCCLGIIRSSNRTGKRAPQAGVHPHAASAGGVAHLMTMRNHATRSHTTCRDLTPISANAHRSHRSRGARRSCHVAVLAAANAAKVGTVNVARGASL